MAIQPNDEKHFRKAFELPLDKAVLLAEMQIDAAIELAAKKNMDQSDESIQRLAQLLATNWAAFTAN